MAPRISAYDTLNNLCEQSIAAFKSSATWEEFASKCRDPMGDFHVDVKHPPYRAANMLDCLCTRGMTVGMKTVKWSKVQKLNALKWGSHKSACQHTDFLCEVFVDMIHKGHWVLLTVNLVLDDENLSLSPLGVIPQLVAGPILYVINLSSW
jgi:hypothetical protein